MKHLIWVYTFLSLPKTTPVFEIDEAARINKKQVCKQDVFRFFYRNFGFFPFPPPPADYSPLPPPPIEAVAAATSVFIFGYWTANQLLFPQRFGWL